MSLVDLHAPMVLFTSVAFPRTKRSRVGRKKLDHATESAKSEAIEACKLKMEEKGEGELEDVVGRMEFHAFAEACGWDADRTISCLRETISWKEQQTFATAAEKNKWSEVVRRIGNDREGKPSLYVSVAQVLRMVETSYQGRTDEGYSHFINCTVSLMEEISAERRESLGFKCIVLVDFTEVSLQSIPWRSLKQMISVLIKHYPRRLGKLYLLNAPVVVRFFLMTVLRMMPTHTQAKTTLVSGDECTTVFSLFDEASLPQTLLERCKSTPGSSITENNVTKNASSFFEKLSTSSISMHPDGLDKCDGLGVHAGKQTQAGAVMLFAIVLYVCAQFTTTMHSVALGSNYEAFS